MDSNDLMVIVGDEDLLRYHDWYAMDEEAVQKWLVNDQQQQLFQQGPNFYLALELLEQPKVIGYVTLTLFEKDNLEVSVSVDVFVNRNYQRRGFGAETFRGAMEFIFAGLNVRRVCCWCDSRNLAGVRLLEKSGLRHEGHFVKCKFMKGEWVDTVQFALLQEEYGSAV
jgi:RimJ/RimL family protein N-acetyltransferase